MKILKLTRIYKNFGDFQYKENPVYILSPEKITHFYVENLHNGNFVTVVVHNENLIFVSESIEVVAQKLKEILSS